VQNHKALLQGLEPYMYMTEANRTSVFATPDTYMYTHAGPRLRSYSARSARVRPQPPLQHCAITERELFEKRA
jgi:hypothetical protein